METAQWIELGDHIVFIIGLDEKIASDTMVDIFANVGLTEAITHFHSDIGLIPTYQRVSHPLDGIYTSSNLQVSAGGYPPFGIIPSDHHLLWLKIDFDSAFDATLDTLLPHTVQRINCQKSNNVKLFIELYENFISDNVLHLKIFHNRTFLSINPPHPPNKKMTEY